MRDRLAIVGAGVLALGAVGLALATVLPIQLPWSINAPEKDAPLAANPARATSGASVDTMEQRPLTERATDALTKLAKEFSWSSEKATPDTKPGASAAPPSGSGNDTDAPTLDVSRISPDSSSVFAGLAKPNSYVTLRENGKPVGTAQADGSGSWSLVTDHKFASLEPKLTFEAKDTPPPVESAAVATAKPKAGASSAEALRKFESVVAEARDGPGGGGQLGGSANTGQVGPVSSSTADEEELAPLPLMFNYNSAELTHEGSRAAALLVEYVQLKKLTALSLSGHADERGSDDYNLALSRQRLETVVGLLRAAGFAGQLDLLAKGKSEPFGGVDREKYSEEALYQLDRRVELRFDRQPGAR